MVKNYLSLVKFGHTVFAMPFALIGFSLAFAGTQYQFSVRLLILVVLCMIFARNAAMGFNRVADRKFDALNPRTRSREIPAGIINTRSATIFVIINSVLFIITTSLINRLTLYLSPVALVVVLGYSLTKRFTSISHLLLGLGLSLAPVGAYISVTGKFQLLPVIYSLVVLTWVGGFDIIYSLQDDEFDRNNKLHSIPSSAGRSKAIIISSLLHALSFLLVIIAGLIGRGELIYWIGAGVFTMLLIYQHLLVRPHDLSKVNMAFATTNGIASIIFAVFTILDLYIRYRK
ncbi:MAG TPA: UbiA-like polyprenyltransferase [Bacteroidales bacterium]|nr:UbiA-like polyprenyltransferase [Bacteroidales bacterium]